MPTKAKVAPTIPSKPLTIESATIKLAAFLIFRLILDETV